MCLDAFVTIATAIPILADEAVPSDIAIPGSILFSDDNRKRTQEGKILVAKFAEMMKKLEQNKSVIQTAVIPVKSNQLVKRVIEFRLFARMFRFFFKTYYFFHQQR